MDAFYWGAQVVLSFLEGDSFFVSSCPSWREKKKMNRRKI